MFTDEFIKMSGADQQQFGQIVNKILLKGFLVRDVFDVKEKIMRINPDYRFVERYFDVMEGYLHIVGWHIEKDNILGVIALSNDFQENRLKIDRETSLILFALRLIYEDEKSENAGVTQSVYLTTPMLIKHMLEHGIVMPGKRLSGRGVARSLRFLESHNIISKVSGRYDEGNISFYILPSIMYAINNEKITVLDQLLSEINGKEDEVDEIINESQNY